MPTCTDADLTVSLHNSYLVKIYVTVTEKSVFSRIGIYVTMRQNRQRNEKILRSVKTLIPSLIDVIWRNENRRWVFCFLFLALEFEWQSGWPPGRVQISFYLVSDVLKKPCFFPPWRTGDWHDNKDCGQREDGEKKRFKTTPQLVKLPSLRLACYIPGFIREAVGNIYLRAYLCVFLCGHLSSPFFFSLSLCSQARSVACWVPRSRKAANVVWLCKGCDYGGFWC